MVENKIVIKNKNLFKWIFILICVVSLFNSTIIISNLVKPSQKDYEMDGYHTRLRELELEMWNCKYYIVQEAERYMDSFAPNNNLSALELLNGCDRYGIDIRLPLCQGKVESLFGTKGLASKTNSVWNVGAYDNHGYDQIEGIFKFSHPNLSIDPYLKLVREKYLGGSRTEQDLLKSFTTIEGDKRYASNKLYEHDLRITWNEINRVTKLDSLLEKYYHLKRELNY